jgi:hypothetical protein
MISARESSVNFQKIFKKTFKNNTLSQPNHNFPKAVLSEQAANNTLIHSPVNCFLGIYDK